MKKENASNESNPCLEFFSNRSAMEGKFWEVLAEKFPACECERFPVSKNSPGPVQNQESIVSVVTSPAFVSHNGKVEPTLFEKRISNGISTDRKSYTTQRAYDERAERLVSENEKKQNMGSIELSVERIRGICHEGNRAIAVYDTALPDNKSHCEIACTEIPEAKTPGRKKIRAQLRKRVLDACLHEALLHKAREGFMSRIQCGSWAT